MRPIMVEEAMGEAYELYGWYRVAAGDGTTIAYVQDKVTAGVVARAIDAVTSATRYPTAEEVAEGKRTDSLPRAAADPVPIPKTGATDYAGVGRIGDPTVVRCGHCDYSSPSIKKVAEHECPGPSPRPADDEPDECPECGREFEEAEG